jgi:hypothetical protein
MNVKYLREVQQLQHKREGYKEALRVMGIYSHVKEYSADLNVNNGLHLKLTKQEIEGLLTTRISAIEGRMKSLGVKL